MVYIVMTKNKTVSRFYYVENPKEATATTKTEINKL